MSEWGVVAVAYGLTWVVLGAYALYLRARLRRAEKALTAVTDQITDQRDEGDG